MNFRPILRGKVIKCAISFLLIIILSLFVGCETKSTKTDSSKKTPVVSVPDDSLTDISSDDDSLVDVLPDDDSLTDISSDDDSLVDISSDGSSTGKDKTYNFDGKYSVSTDVIISRDDAKEKFYNGNSANLSTPSNGYAEKEATALRNRILKAKNTEANYKITGKKYYISPGGDDTNDGLSEKTPFRTPFILSGLDLKSGDAVLFERDSIFRISSTISTKSGVVYGSYGKGEKPQIYASPVRLADSTLWSPTKTKNIWKVSYPYNEVGSIVFDHGKTIAYKKHKIKEMTKDYDFYHDDDSGILYLYYSNGNPGKHFSSIEASSAIFIFTVPTSAKNVVIDNICLKYSSYMGIHIDYAKNVTITNCEIGFIGGKDYSAKVRFGNAIEAWCGADNLIVENNWIYQTFDSAITWQGDSGGEYGNISVKNNLLEYNNADIEFWDSKEHSLENVSMVGNIMRFTSMGWGTRLDDGGVRSIEGIVVGNSRLAKASNISFSNNIIDSPAREIIKWDFSSDFYKVLKTTGNKVYINSKYRTSKDVVKNSEMQNYSANNLPELKKAFSVFDKTAKLFWK